MSVSRFYLAFVGKALPSKHSWAIAGQLDGCVIASFSADSKAMEIEPVFSSPAPGDIDKLLHEPARLLIMVNLTAAQSSDFKTLMIQTNLSWGNLSSHLMKLESAGYIAMEKSFVERRPHTTIILTHSGRAALISYRTTMEKVLSSISE